MAVTNHRPLPCSSPFFSVFTSTSHQSTTSPTLRFLSFPRRNSRLSSLPPPQCNSSQTTSNSTPSSPLPSPSIFLSFLEEQDNKELEVDVAAEEEAVAEEKAIESEEEEGIQGEEECPDDPIYRFFKSRTTTKDPPRVSRIKLRRDRRNTWHLVGNDAASSDEDPATTSENGAELAVLKRREAAEEQGGAQVEGGGSELGVVGEILEIARTLPENTTLGEKLGGFEGRLGEEECVEALELLIEEGFLIGCLYFYEWMEMQAPSLVSPRACSVLFPALGKGGMGDKIMVLWRNLPIAGRRFGDVHVYNAALSGLLCSARYEDAWEVYNAMEMNNVLPDRVSGSVMITIMRKEGKTAKEAWKFFERMNRKGVEWSLEVIGALIKLFCNEGLRKQALIIQAEMEKKGLSSNIIIYNTLMDAYCKSNQLEEAEALFAELRSKGLSPTTPTFNILMDAYSKRMQPEIVEKLLQEMQDMHLEPDVKSYTSLISAYGRKEDMSDLAADAFLRMKRAGIKPTSHSYTALVHAYSISGWYEKAYKAFENMLIEGIKPSVETYTALLDAFRRVGDTKMLTKIWKSMIHEKIQGTRVTFNILLDGFAKQGQYVEARDVIYEFAKIGFQPTVMTYNMLMNAYARGGQHLKLPQLLNEMQDRDLEPDSITYSIMIYAFVRVRDFKRAFFYHRKMVKSGQVPDAKSYEKLRSILDVKAAKKNKSDRLAIEGIVKSKMGLLKVKKKGKKDEFWKAAKKRPKSLGLPKPK